MLLHELLYGQSSTQIAELYSAPKTDWGSVGRPMTKTHKSLNAAVIQQRNTPNHTFLGNGSYAYVGTNDDANFGDVHRIALQDDGGSVYLNYIAAHPNLRDNPFVPRVRAVKIDGEIQTTIVERLIPFDAKAIIGNELLMHAICKRYFVDISPIYQTPRPGRITEFITEELYRAIRHKNTENIKDDHLYEIIHVLCHLLDTYDTFEPDTHEGNLMWRPHPYQPQLVITDPLA